ncbi:hypothetical protein Csp2054_02545 [Curtobacterium sp. 'Ferrero']|uniref:phage holin family protein n=1 Tax=Curtobacterium sp. 'Ferrero' TaxID=2033654 RepID=UPI000BD423DB|nr:phage holin family protein [Curtobacterium sp. 'Ferrero']PCN49097.1 hypothetical protein Csp2054_02545 [Curtobacterium sp. 'Ferrero']
MNATDHDDDRVSGGRSVRDGLAAGLLQKAVEPLLRAVREEVAAAKREIGDRARGARTGLVLTGAAVAFALATLLLLAGLIVALLALALPVWAATGITFVVFALVTGVLAAVGIRGIRRGVPPVPKDTLRAAKDRVARSSEEPGQG